MITHVILQIGEKILDSRKISFCNFGNDIAITKERQKNGFIDEKLSGKFSLFGEAFSEINRNTSLNAPECSMGLFDADKEIFRGKFTWADCEIDYDNEIMTVNPSNAYTVSDKFDEILNEEINVLTLRPESSLIKCWHNAVLQIVMAMGNTFSSHALNWVNGTFYDCDIKIDADLNASNFGKTEYKDNSYHVSWSSFSGSGYIIFDGKNLRDSRGFMIRFSSTSRFIGGRFETVITSTWYNPNGVVQRTLSNTYYGQSVPSWQDHMGDFNISKDQSIACELYMRLLTHTKRSIDGILPKSDNDVDPETRFNYASPIALGHALPSTNTYFKMSTRQGVKPTIWGISSDNKYYYPPDDDGDYIPFCQDLWKNNVSFWFNKKANLNTAIYDAYKHGVAANVHGYRFTELIKSILDNKNISLEINTKNNPEADFNLFVVPASNVIRFPYAKPASQLNTTLKKLLDTYCTITNSEYFLREKKLVIQSKYITNYIAGYTSQMNLTEDYWSGVLQKISFGQNIVKSLAPPIASASVSYQAEKVDDVFGGKTYYNLDTIKDSNSETIQIGCDADIALAFVAPNKFSDATTNFFAVAVKPSDSSILVSSNTTLVPGGQSIDNLRLSPEYLLYQYWKYYLGCSSYKVQGAFTEWTKTCFATSPMKSATYRFPVKSVDQIDFFKAITTDLGKGLINKLTINLIDYTAEAELKFA